MSLFADPYGGSSNPYGGYSAPSSYPGQGSIGRNILEDNPMAAYQQLLDHLFGVSTGNDARSRFYAGQNNNWYNRFLSTASQNGQPGYGYSDFLQQNQNQIGSAFGDASPTARGENPSQFAPRMRYVGFPG